MLKPVEFVYLAIALAIVVQQIIVRHGAFDPVAAGLASLFIGLIPAGRRDRKTKDGDSPSLLVRIIRAIQNDESGKNGGEGQ
jgi:hypothetical protein